MPVPIDLTKINTIDDALNSMNQIKTTSNTKDGVYWFNYLYLRVTEGIKASVTANNIVWNNPAWLNTLDVVFAKFYFQAYNQYIKGEPTSKAWQPLFEATNNQHIARIQFALAGMNAHINHDLPIAIVTTSQQLGIIPTSTSLEHQDFEKVNIILEQVERQVKGDILSGVEGELTQHLKGVDDVIANWSVKKARETAWLNAEALWHLTAIAFMENKFLQALDNTVGLVGRTLLVHTLP